MNWDAIGAISELVGAIAVVASLAYLAFQIRQNTRQLEQNERISIATSVSASATTYRENRRYIFTTSEVATIHFKGLTDPDSLDEIERHRFRLLMSNFADANWDMYAQTVITGFSPETWERQGIRAVKRTLGAPGGRWFWLNFREDYPEAFRTEIDRILARTTPLDSMD